MEKPLVSFCLLVYNQENYVKEALWSVLNQTYQPIEIIISDDCSSDNTIKIIEKELLKYKGDNKIIFNKNSKNIGLVNHVNKILYDVSSGDYVALAAGDDISESERISKSVEFLLNNPNVCALSTSLNVIDEHSKIINKHPSNTENNIIYDVNYFLSENYKHINGPSRILRRELINAFPRLNSNCHTEDTTFLFRAFLYGKVALLSEELVRYRQHDNNMSSPDGLKKMKIGNIFQQYQDDLAYSNKKYIDEIVFNNLEMKLKKNEKVRNELNRTVLNNISYLSFKSRILKYIRHKFQ